jgi:hypothetical protein
VFNTYAPIAYGTVTVTSTSAGSVTFQNLKPGVYTLVLYNQTYSNIGVTFSGVAYGLQTVTSENNPFYIATASFIVTSTGNATAAIVTSTNSSVNIVYLLYQTVPVILGSPLCPAIPVTSNEYSQYGLLQISLTSLNKYYTVSSVLSRPISFYRIHNGFVYNSTSTSVIVSMKLFNINYSFSLTAGMTQWIGQWVQGVYAPTNEPFFIVTSGSVPVYIDLSVEVH